MTDKKKISLLFFLLLLLVLFTGYSWEYSETDINLQSRIAMMGRWGLFNPYVEALGEYEVMEGDYLFGSLTAGTYFKAAPFLKIGAFYRFQSGARHLNDWRFIAGPPDRHWWEETDGRKEHLLLFDATPRFLLDFLPGGNWVAPLKIRYIFNVSEKLHSLKIRPGLTYVLMPNREPILNISLQYNLYLALNWGDIPLYSHGPYLSVIGHINDWMKMEGRFSYSFSKYYVEEGNWLLKNHKFTTGLGIIFTPDFNR